MKRLVVGLLYAALAAGVTLLAGYLAVSFLVERAPEVTVPELAGNTLSEALDALAAAELDLEVREFRYSDQVEENRIVRQSPAPGRVVKAGRAVGVVLSRGPERHPAPDVRGLSLEDARILLEEAGLATEVAARIPGPPENQIIAQDQVPGVRLARGERVRLIASSGATPQRYRMPRFEGRTIEETLAELDGAGLRVERIEEVELGDPSRDGRVVSQEPLPGFPVRADTGVVLAVAGSLRGGGATRAVWISRHLPEGFARHRVQVGVDDGVRTWLLADEWVPGGTTFRRWVPLRVGDKLHFQIDDGDAAPGASGSGMRPSLRAQEQP